MSIVLSFSISPYLLHVRFFAVFVMFSCSGNGGSFNLIFFNEIEVHVIHFFSTRITFAGSLSFAYVFLAAEPFSCVHYWKLSLLAFCCVIGFFRFIYLIF